MLEVIQQVNARKTWIFSRPGRPLVRCDESVPGRWGQPEIDGVDPGRLGLDIQALKQVQEMQHASLAQAVLTESEERFSQRGGQRPVFIWVSNPDKLYTCFNSHGWKFRCPDDRTGNKATGWTEGVPRMTFQVPGDLPGQEFDDARPEFPDGITGCGGAAAGQ